MSGSSAEPEKSGCWGYLIGFLVVIALIVLIGIAFSTIDWLYGVVTVVGLALLVLTFLFGPGVPAFTAVVGVLILEWYLFACHPAIACIIFGVIVVLLILLRFSY